MGVLYYPLEVFSPQVIGGEDQGFFKKRRAIVLEKKQRSDLLKRICGEIKAQDEILARATGVLPAERHSDVSDIATEEEVYAQAVREIRRAEAYRSKLVARQAAINGGDCCQCHGCGESIPFERLAVEPTATLCVPCKEYIGQQNERDYGIRPGMRALARV